MLDLELSKIILIGVVALIVIGPEKLPHLARVAGTLFGRAQRYLNKVKAEVKREIELDEFKRVKQEFQNAVFKAQTDITHQLEKTQQGFQSTLQEDTYTQPYYKPVMPCETKIKRHDFRRKKLARTSAIPAWYKQRYGIRTHTLSGAARLARYRSSQSTDSFF